MNLGINRLALHRISRASADQRAGRAGREAPGRCIRFWSRQTHTRLPARTIAEMRRTDLAPIVMVLKSVGILDPLTFEFLDAPTTERLSAAEQFLVRMGAVSADRQLTKTGWMMLRLPLPPRYARMVVEAERSGCLKEVTNVAALMSGRPILFAPSERGRRKPAKIEFAQDDSSDFFSLLRMFWVSWRNERAPEWCEEHGVNRDALLEAARLRRKILRVAIERGSRQNQRAVHPAMVRRCFLSGLVDRVAIRQGQGYRLTNGFECGAAKDSVVRGDLLAAADIRLMPRRRRRRGEPEGGVIGFVTRIEASMLHQVAPRLCAAIRIPVSLDMQAASMVIRTEFRYFDSVIEYREDRVDIVDGIAIIAEQSVRARANGWVRVNIELGIGRRGSVRFCGRRTSVPTDASGPHWAVVHDGDILAVTIKERIIEVPGMEDEDRSPVPPSLLDRLQGVSAAVAKLTR